LVQVDEDHFKESFPHIPTGSAIVDYLIGGRPNKYGVLPCPGFPRGRLVNLYGMESAGKTTLCLTVCAQVAAMGGSTCYIDWEHTLELSYAKSLGVPVDDPDLFVLYQPESLEKGLSILWTAAKAGIDLIVLDSTGAAVPNQVLEQAIDDKGGQTRIGLAAAIWSRFLPELKGITARSGSCVVGISQLRKKISTGFGAGRGEGTTVQGGEAWKFYSEVRIGLRRIKFEKGKVYSIIENKMIDDVVRSQIQVKIDKCKLAGSQGMSANFFINHEEGIDDLRSIIDIAIAHKIVQKGGAWFEFTMGNGKVLRGQGMQGFKDLLRTEDGALDELYKRTLDRLAQVAKESLMTTDNFEDDFDDDISEIDAILGKGNVEESEDEDFDDGE